MFGTSNGRGLKTIFGVAVMCILLLTLLLFLDRHVMFLLQQLKTWDFVELAQDEEYGPIIISAGPRFLEAPPNDV